MKTEYGVIYLIRNLLNGKCYVGQTAHFIQRKSKYKHGKSHTPHLNNVINKYGFHAFKIEILEVCPIEDLWAREQFWIATLNTFHNGYNLTKGGEGRRGWEMSQEHKDKIRQSVLQWQSENPDKVQKPKKPKRSRSESRKEWLSIPENRQKQLEYLAKAREMSAKKRKGKTRSGRPRKKENLRWIKTREH